MTDGERIQGETSAAPSIESGPPSDQPAGQAEVDAWMLPSVPTEGTMIVEETGALEIRYDHDGPYTASDPDSVAPDAEIPTAAAAAVDQRAEQSTPVDTAPTQPTPAGIPPHILEAKDRAIQALKEAGLGPERVIPISRLVHIAFGELRLPQEDFRAFTRAIRKDPRMSHRNHSHFSLRAAETVVKVVAHEERARAPDPQLVLLADQAVLTLSKVGGRWGLNRDQTLGLIRSTGTHLDEKEEKQLLRLVNGHPNVTTLDDGNFSYIPDSEFTPQSGDFWTGIRAPENERSRHEDQ